MTARQLTQIVGCGFAAALTAASLLVATSVLAQDSGAKPASDATRAANAKLLNELPFANTQEFEDAKAGFIAPLPDNGVIRNDKGETIYDLSKFTAFIAEGKGAPDTVNPSLWRQSQLLMLGGLFKVADGIYQVRAADLSNITFIEAPDGLVVVDPLISAETAKYALEELREGVKKLGAPSTASPDTIRAMDLDLLFDYAAMRLNGPKAEGKSMKFNWSFTDTNQQYVIELQNGALSHIAGRQATDADATVSLTRAKLNDVLLGQTTFEKEFDGGSISITGNPAPLKDLLSMLDTFEFWFNIVTPVDMPNR